MASSLSPDALRILADLFGPKSNLQVPAAWARVVIEIEQWAAAQLAEQSNAEQVAVVNRKSHKVEG